jgi:hypothetical protein
MIRLLGRVEQKYPVLLEYAIRAWHSAAVEKKRAAGAAVRRLILAPRGLTGLLNPLSIWHKTYFSRISWIVSMCFSRRCWSRSAPCLICALG